MKKIAFVFLFGSAFLAGCPEHDVIPAPEPKVDLEAHFIGTINSTSVDFTENVSGYAMDATKTTVNAPAPTPSSAIYYAEMKSASPSTAVKIAFGSVKWDSNIASEPPLATFNTFFTTTANLTPAYSDEGLEGFAVYYTDAAGVTWKTKETDPGLVSFSNVIQESDKTGDYSKFTCSFSCTVYHQVNDTTEHSLEITDAVFKGWFKR